jgi:precorrin-6B methylase 1
MGVRKPRDVQKDGVYKMIQIKKTKSISMLADENGVDIFIVKTGDPLFIPSNLVFQVKRGLESYVQRFYRKAKK